MRFSSTQKLLTFALAVTSAIPVLSSGEVGTFWVLLFALLVVVGWLVELPFAAHPRYRRLVTALVLGLLALQLARFAAGAPLAKLGMEFAATLLGIKLASRGSAADYQQIGILAFLHVIAATVVMDDLSWGASFLVFVLLSAPMLALAHLRKEMEQRFSPGHRGEPNPVLDRLLASRRIVSSGFVVGTGFLSLPVLLITALLFVGFPRFGLGFLGRLSREQAIAGFSDEVQLGDLDLIKLEDTVLLRLEPLGRHRPQQRLSLRLRGAVFDRFEQSTWKRGKSWRWSPLPHRGDDHRLGGPSITAQTLGYEVLLESLAPSILFVPQGTGQITTFPLARGGVLSPRTLEQNGLGAIRYEDKAKVGIRYRVYINGAPPHGPPPHAADLALPPPSAQLVARARELAGSGTPGQRARQLIAGLRKNYKYSTSLAASDANALARTPLDRFLFARRTGTCEHFATALTLMLRAQGIPARMVTGFGGADWNPIGEYYAVRQRSAHSWTEAFLGERWVTLDATPAVEGGSSRFPTSGLALAIDALRMRWHKHVVGFDAAVQVELALQLRETWRKMFGRGSVAGQGLPRWMLGAVVIVLLGLAAFWVIRRQPRIRLGLARALRPASHVRASALYAKLQVRLNKLHHPRPPWITPAEHAAHMNSSESPLAGAVDQITARYNQVRFGGDKFRTDEIPRLEALIRSLKKS